MLVQGWALAYAFAEGITEPDQTSPVRVPHFALSHCSGPTRQDAGIGRSSAGTPSADERGAPGLLREL